MVRQAPGRYVIQSLMRASQVVYVFRSEGEVLRLRDLLARTGLNKMTCFRLVCTLHQRGFPEKVAGNQYRPRFSSFMKHRLITRDNIDNVYPNDGLLGP